MSFLSRIKYLGCNDTYFKFIDILVAVNICTIIFPIGESSILIQCNMYWFKMMSFLSMLYLHDTSFSFKGFPKKSERNSLIVERRKYHFTFTDDDELDFGSGSHEIDFGGSGQYLSPGGFFSDDDERGIVKEKYYEETNEIESNVAHLEDETDEVETADEIELIEERNDLIVNKIYMEDKDYHADNEQLTDSISKDSIVQDENGELKFRSEINIDANENENSIIEDENDRLKFRNKINRGADENGNDEEITTDEENQIYEDHEDKESRENEIDSTENRKGKNYEFEAVEFVNNSSSKSHILGSFVYTLILLCSFIFLISY